jgi:site-specific recombinase XerD
LPATAPATVARRLSCLSGFYDYGLREVELLGYSPVANVRRGRGSRVAEDSPTIGLDAAELDRLLGAAERDSPRSAALIALLDEPQPGRRLPVRRAFRPETIPL